MIYSPELLDRLEAIPTSPWEGQVWRHMIGDRPPSVANTRGARWNPPDVPAIYTSVDRETAVAEGNFLVSIQPVRPTATRTLYEIQVGLQKVVDLTSRDLLAELGVGEAQLVDFNHESCRLVGGAVAWLNRDGLLVPSARAQGENLVIFVANCLNPDSVFEVVTEVQLS